MAKQAAVKGFWGPMLAQPSSLAQGRRSRQPHREVQLKRSIGLLAQHQRPVLAFGQQTGYVKLHPVQLWSSLFAEIARCQEREQPPGLFLRQVWSVVPKHNMRFSLALIQPDLD